MSSESIFCFIYFKLFFEYGGHMSLCIDNGVCVRACVHVCVCLSVSVCLYMYILYKYIYIYIYTHTYIYICTGILVCELTPRVHHNLFGKDCINQATVQ